MPATWSKVNVLGSGLECSRRVVEESTLKHKFCSPSADPEPSVGGRIRTKTLMASPSLLKTKHVAAEFTEENGRKWIRCIQAHMDLRLTWPLLLLYWEVPQPSPRCTPFTLTSFMSPTWPTPFTDLLQDSHLHKPLLEINSEGVDSKELQALLVSSFPLRSYNKMGDIDPNV